MNQGYHLVRCKCLSCGHRFLVKSREATGIQKIRCPKCKTGIAETRETALWATEKVDPILRFAIIYGEKIPISIIALLGVIPTKKNVEYERLGILRIMLEQFRYAMAHFIGLGDKLSDILIAKALGEAEEK